MSATEVTLPTTHVAPQIKSKTMKALVYHGPGKSAWEDKPMPAIQKPGDAIFASAGCTRIAAKADGSWAI